MLFPSLQTPLLIPAALDRHSGPSSRFPAPLLHPGQGLVLTPALHSTAGPDPSCPPSPGRQLCRSEPAAGTDLLGRKELGNNCSHSCSRKIRGNQDG